MPTAVDALPLPAERVSDTPNLPNLIEIHKKRAHDLRAEYLRSLPGAFSSFLARIIRRVTGKQPNAQPT